MNLRYLLSVILLTLTFIITIPFALNHLPLQPADIAIVALLPVATWGLVLHGKGGWFNYPSVVNPMNDRKKRNFYKLLLSTAMALQWSLIFVTILWRMSPTFTLPRYFGLIPDPLVYLQVYLLQLYLHIYNLRVISPGIIFVVVFAFSYLVARDENSVRGAGLKLAYPFLLAGYIPLAIYILSSTEQFGAIPSIIVLAIASVAIIGIPYYFKSKKVANWFLTLEMLAYALYGSIGLITFEGSEIPLAMALFANAMALILAVALANFEDICHQERHIADSFSSLGRLKKAYPLVVLVAILGVFYTAFTIAQYGSFGLVQVNLMSPFRLFILSGSIYFPVIFFSIGLVWFFAAILGNRASQPITYGILIVFFFMGAFFLFSQSVSGIWNVGNRSPIIALAVAAVLFYEPVNSFISTNYVRLPERLSINYWLVRSKLLHGRYRPVSEIGTGGYARVVKVYDMHTGMQLALKQAIVKYDNSNPPSEEDLKVSIDSSVDKLNYEYTVLSNCHFPLIVSAKDRFQEGESKKIPSGSETIYMLNQYMAEEFVDGVTLDHLRRAGTILTEEQIRHYLKRILLAVNYLHQHGIVHRDLTPGNIMILNGTREIKIIDFGLAKKAHALGYATKSAGMFGGTPTGPVGTEGYYAPELLSALDTETGIEIDEKFDIYSVGALGFFLATMSDPPSLQSLVSSSKDPGYDLGRFIEIKMKNVGRSAQLTGIVRRAMAFDPRERYQSAFEFFAALSGLHGRYIINDAGEIYELNPSMEYTVQYQQYALDKYDYAQNIGEVVSNRLITLRTSRDSGVLGGLNYDSGQATFKLTPREGSKFYTSPQSGQGKPVEHSGFFFLRSGTNAFVSYKNVGVVRFLSRDYIPDGAFRYYEVR